MQPQIRRVGIVLVFAFLAVFMQLNYLQIFAAKRIAGNNANVRQLYREYSIKRGDILTLDGKVVATSKATDGNLKYERTYPGRELYGHLTGYYSINYGTSRIESAYNEELLGEGGVVSIQEIQDRFSGSEQKAGDDVRM